MMSSAGLASLAVWRPFRSAGARIFDIIGPTLHGRETEETSAANSGWITLLSLSASVGLFLIAAGHGAGRRGEADAGVLFWSGVILLVLPIVGRVAWPVVSRGERLFLLLLLTESLFFYKILYSPTSFVLFDEMLHWITADDILHRHQLFLGNSLLPISPSYPGIEILTTAFANLAGLTVFAASNWVLAVLRATFVTALFLFFEKISGSARVAALACLVYMGCSNFVIFDAMFAYESLGIVLFVLTALAEATAPKRWGTGSPGALALIAMFLASLAVTHHISAFFCAGYLVCLLAIEMLRRDDNLPLRARIGVTAGAAVLAVVLPVMWIYARGNPIGAYLGPVIANGIAGLIDKLNGSSAIRVPFTGADGVGQAIGYRIAGVASILLVAIGLATGFFRSLALSGATVGATSGWARLRAVAHRKWHDSRVVLLTVAAFGFPVSVAFRLAPAGWEIGNRMGTFVFVAVGFVVAVSIVHFCQARLSRWNHLAIGLAVGAIVLGGITTGSGGLAVRGEYRPGADPESIEPMGVAAAVWTRTWLGEGNRFAADRVSRTLLATYGQQDVVTSIADRVDASRTFLSEKLSPDSLYPIRRGKIDFLLVDLRTTTAPAVLGEYYEKNEKTRGRPPSPSSLLKFDMAERVGRVFDNGWMVIFDVRGLHAAN
jgi:hypothetical protein